MKTLNFIIGGIINLYIKLYVGIISLVGIIW